MRTCLNGNILPVEQYMLGQSPGHSGGLPTAWAGYAILVAVGVLLVRCGPAYEPGPSAKSSTGASTLPAALYPSPIDGCPNLERAVVVGSLAASDETSLVVDLNVLADPANSQALFTIADQTLWPMLRTNWPKAPSPKYAKAEISIGRGAADAYASVVEHSCGTEAVNKSWVVVFCATGGPLPSCQPAMTEHAFFLNRDGHWLIWQFWP